MPVIHVSAPTLDDVRSRAELTAVITDAAAACLEIAPEKVQVFLRPASSVEILVQAVDKHIYQCGQLLGEVCEAAVALLPEHHHVSASVEMFNPEYTAKGGRLRDPA